MKTLASIAAEVGAELSRPESAQATIARVSAFSNAGPDALVFIEQAAALQAAISCLPGAIVAPADAPAISGNTVPLLLSSNPRIAFARAARFIAQRPKSGTIHPTAVIEHPELLGENVAVGPRAVIANAVIGSNSSIGPGCCIADGVEIGTDCTLYPNVTIYAGTTIGNRVVVHAGAVLGADGFGYVRDPSNGSYLQFPQQGTLVIENDVEIGANTTIDRGALEETRIGSGTKLDNLVHIGHNCHIGKNVVIASQAGISGSCVIGDGAILGGQVGMGDHVVIGENVILGGGSGVLPHKILRGPHQIFWGTPAKPLKQYLKELAALGKLGRPVPRSTEVGK